MSDGSTKVSKTYVKRQVASPKPCTVCYSLTTTCMYNPNLYRGLADWFYCCDSHLQDNAKFMAPIYDSEYNSTLEDIKQNELQLKTAQNKLRAHGSWDTWLNGIMSKKSKTEDKTESKENKKDEKETETSAKEQNKKVSVEQELKNEIKKLIEESTVLSGKLSKLRTSVKNFELNDALYQSKVISIQQKLKQQQEKKKQEESFTHTNVDEILTKFPSAPKNLQL